MVKANEARILMYLETVPRDQRFMSRIAQKLDIDTSYAISLLGRMVFKEWITKHKTPTKTYYTVVVGSWPRDEVIKKLSERRTK